MTWQTDNGCEFLENQDEQGLPATVRALGSDHRYIPPKRYTWQSDVETVHRLVQDEFFDRESFTGPADFWRKVTTYWLYFNLVRPNRGKEWQSPLQILKANAPALAGALLNWTPLNFAKRHNAYLPPPNNRGHDLPSFLCRWQNQAMTLRLKNLTKTMSEVVFPGQVEYHVNVEGERLPLRCPHHKSAHRRVEVRPPLFRRKLAGHLPRLGGNSPALGFIRVIELLSLDCFLSHDDAKLPTALAQRQRNVPVESPD